MSKTTTRRVLAGLFSGLTLSLLSIPALAQGVPPIAHDPMEGASCTSPTDCGGKLNCVNQKCMSPAAGGGTTGNGGASNPSSGGGAGGGGSSKGSSSGGSSASGSSGSDGGSGKTWKTFDGLRPFVGITLGGGPTYGHSSFGGSTVGGFLFAIKGGILIDRFELGAEISPVTFLPATSGSPILQANIYGGYHIPLAKISGVGEITYPLRLGIGVAGVNTNGTALFEGRADLIGVSGILGPVLVDLHAPSFRFFANEYGYVMHFMFGIGVAILPDAF